MASLASSSSSRSSSSSFCSSSRYSRSSLSSIRTEGSGQSDPVFLPFLDRGFGEEASIINSHSMGSYAPKQGEPEPFLGRCGDLSSFVGYGGNVESFASYGGERESFGGYQGDGKSCIGGYQGDRSHGDSLQVSSGRPASMGAVRAAGDGYYLSADVSQFEPHDVVVMAYNHSIVIHAEKVGEDGCVRDKFTHKSLLPEDMDPLSVSGTLTAQGMLVVSVRRISK